MCESVARLRLCRLAWSWPGLARVAVGLAGDCSGGQDNEVGGHQLEEGHEEQKSEFGKVWSLQGLTRTGFEAK